MSRTTTTSTNASRQIAGAAFSTAFIDLAALQLTLRSLRGDYLDLEAELRTLMAEHTSAQNEANYWREKHVALEREYHDIVLARGLRAQNELCVARGLMGEANQEVRVGKAMRTMIEGREKRWRHWRDSVVGQVGRRGREWRKRLGRVLEREVVEI